MGVALLFILSTLDITHKEEITDSVATEIVEPQYEYGILLDSFIVINRNCKARPNSWRDTLRKPYYPP